LPISIGRCAADEGAPVPDRVLVQGHDRGLQIAIESCAGSETRPCSHRDGAEDLPVALERVAFDASLDPRLAADSEVPDPAKAPSIRVGPTIAT
jgi:hypothetical protein